MEFESNEFKRDLFSAILQKDVVQVFVNKHPGVVLADQVKLPCMLEYGLNMANPITELTVTKEGIFATMSFEATPWATFVPWEAVAVIRLADRSFAVVWNKRDLPAAPHRPSQDVASMLSS
jgi:hypothetical protein